MQDLTWQVPNHVGHIGTNLTLWHKGPFVIMQCTPLSSNLLFALEGIVTIVQATIVEADQDFVMEEGF